MEEREKVVKHMWDLYTNNRRIRLPRFWQEAFEAAYEDLTSDVPEVREAAISEIAKMSLHSIDIEPSPLQSSVCILSLSFPVYVSTALQNIYCIFRLFERKKRLIGNVVEDKWCLAHYVIIDEIISQ